ncbi:MAG: conjugal transfer protein TrbE, partial [Phycisphaerae bacterium]
RRHPQRLSDHLAWALLLAPGVILNKDGSFQRTIRLRGPDVDSATKSELMALRARLNNVLRRFGSGWCLHVEERRRRVHCNESSVFPNTIAKQIEKERIRLLERSPAFESVHHLTLTYLSPPDQVRRASNLLLTEPDHNRGQNRSFYRDQLDLFRRRIEQVVNVLRTFMPEVEPLDDDETLSYLHDCVSERHLRVRTPHTPCYLDEFLTDTPLTGGLSPRLGRQYLKTVAVHAFPNKTMPCLLAALNELPIEFLWCARYVPMDKHNAESTLKSLRHHWYARRKGIVTLLKEFVTKEESALTDPDSLNKAEEISDALEGLGADYYSFGEFTLTLTTSAEDEHIAEQNAQSLQRVCDSVGLVTRIEDYNALQAWFGSLPGHAYADRRRPLISSLNLCDLIPISSIWPGEHRNAHLNGPPLAVVHTSGSTPFRFNLHHGDVGHTLALGPTGTGKSTLLSFTAQQAQRYPGAQVYFFDKGKSILPMTLAMGGEFYELAADSSEISFQPLSAIEGEGELAWAEGWLADILEREGVEVNAELKRELWSALKNLAGMPVEHRTLSTFSGLVSSNTVRTALESYTVDGPYGKLLDADHDSLRHATWQAFEMEALMGSPALVPVLWYLFHRLEQRFGTFFNDPMSGKKRARPTFLFLDEAWLFLAHSMFADKIREWLKTLRKKNVAVVFATQSLADVAESPIASAIIESCPTRVFLPNPAAWEGHSRRLYEAFGLNERQIMILQHAVPKRDYYYQSPAGNRLFELGLGPVALALCSGGSPDVQARIPGLIEKHGKDGFADAYLKEFGLTVEGEGTDEASENPQTANA